MVATADAVGALLMNVFLAVVTFPNRGAFSWASLHGATKSADIVI
jgi:hypothetical protein